MTSRLRMLLPPPWVIGMAAFCYVAIEATFVLAQWQEFDAELERGFHVMRAVFLGFSLAAWALWRVCWFHPLTRPGYFEWLHTMPWRHPQPLPLGPVLPTWEDAVIVAAAVGLAVVRHADQEPLLVPVAFLLTWSGAMSLLLWETGERVCAFSVWMGAALVLHFVAATVQALVTAPLTGESARTAAVAAVIVSVAVAAVAAQGMRRSLPRFHEWDVKWRSRTRKARLPESARDISPQHLGWPVARLNPQPPSGGISRAQALAFSLLAGWWCYWLPGTPEDRLLPLAFCGAVAVVVRMARYLDGYALPISLRGRIGTGRLIIPGYDRVLVAPALAMLAGAGIPFACLSAGWDLGIGVPVAMTATLLVSLGMGPTLEEWRLTGNHRIVAGFAHL